MIQERAFVEAIRDEPDEALHRFAWADWLDDHGQTRRADFIRAQVRARTLATNDPARDALDDEADDLLAGHDAEWAGKVGERVLEWTWKGGCIERVTLWAETLATHGEELFGLAPIRELRILTETGDMPRLAGCELLRHIEAIDLGRTAADSLHGIIYHRDLPLQHLFRSPHLKRLRRLRLANQGIEGPALQTLFDTGLFARLAELDLSDNKAIGGRAARLLAAERSNTLESLELVGTNLTDFGVRHLLQARSWPALRRLDVQMSQLFPRGWVPEQFEREWIIAPLTSQLTTFRFSNLAVQPESLDALLAWEGLSRIEELYLPNCQLGAAGAERLASCAGVRNLRRLDLSGNRLMDSGAKALGASQYLSQVGELDLARNAIGGPGIAAVMAMRQMTELNLSGNYVGANGSQVIASSKSRRLRRLELEDANLDAEAAGHLAKAESLARLRALVLTNNPLGDDGIEVLAASATLRRLHELTLTSCGLDERGAKAIVESAHLDRLGRLVARNAYISARQREALAVRFGAGAMF